MTVQPTQQVTTSAFPDVQLRTFISRRASELQNRYLTKDSASKAVLAHLRNCVGRAVGADPNLWEVVFRSFPKDLVGRADAPNRYEIAAHNALALFAVHMQSARRPMHVADVGLGAAIRVLAREEGADDLSSPVLRRFHMLGTSSSLPETLHHARGLIQQLRAHDIGLDYGRLAVDLVKLQTPGREDSVRLRWARDLYKQETPTQTEEQE